jgi:transposase-like protein
MIETICPYCKSELLATAQKYNGWTKCYCNACNKEFVVNDNIVTKQRLDDFEKKVLKRLDDLEKYVADLKCAVEYLEQELDDSDVYSEDSWLDEDDDEN